MRSYTHIAGALLLYISFSYLINLNNLYLGLFVAGWISLFPDILERLLGTHRGYGHSIFWLIPFILISFFNITIGVGFVMGIYHMLFWIYLQPMDLPYYTHCLKQILLY